MATRHFDSYIIRVTATQSDGLRLTIGFMIDADAFDALKNTHNFEVTDNGRFLFCSDEEFYRIDEAIKTYKLVLIPSNRGNGWYKPDKKEATS